MSPRPDQESSQAWRMANSGASVFTRTAARGGEQESATRDGVHGRWGRQAGSRRRRDLSGHRDRDLAPPMGEVDVEGALDVGGVLGIHSDTDGVEPWRENCLHPGRRRVAEES